MSKWVHWDCPDCGRTNDAPAPEIEAMQDLAETVILVCAHPRCSDGVTNTDEVETELKNESRDPWGEVSR